MNNEGESSQAPKFENKEQKIEIESEPPSPTKSPKPTKLPDDLVVDSLLLSPDRKYAVTYNRDSLDLKQFICGWQLDQDQPVKQAENESYQPISFKLDSDWDHRITVLNLAIKKKVSLKLYPYSNDIPVIRAEFYNNEDFVMYPSCEGTNNYCFILNGSFKNLHNDKQSWTIDNSIFCGKIRDVEDHTINKGKILLLDKGGSLTQ
ncbi:hypothetical protein C2G38_2217430 [Gigaspora rosea]|uniref:Uncharacterized protein n=1 Tax=Gigaspora rosea TaxID=44941 RepID=A0A397UB36_9GLOM|nr:hypothetical protein C2G38_2217430 [Gigaspora rosea]